MKLRRILLIISICLIQVCFIPELFAQATIKQIHASGPTGKIINLVYLSEGYTTAQLPQFLVDATNVMNSLLSQPPWSAYSSYFNVFAISIASVQSGSDHYTPTINLVNTYFNSTFDSYGTQRLLTIPPNDHDGNYDDGSGKVVALLQQLMPEYDVAGLVVNDTTYGGSGGTFLLASVNSSSAEIANHEIGHTFARLGDEYSSAYPGYPDDEEPNTTTNTTRATIKWNAWIAATTPVPTPDVSGNYALDGLFLGAHYHTTGWYRPKHDCKMRTLGVPYCEICAQELVLSMYRLIRPIQSFLPLTTSLAISSQDNAAFSISILNPSTANLNLQWFTNGVAAGGATSTNFLIASGLLRGGTNEIKVLVNDPTGYVRTDPANSLWDTNVWTLSVILPPTIVNPQLSSSKTTFTLSTPTQVGFQYVLEFKNMLEDPNWTPIQTNGGNGGMITLTNTGLAGPSRFYHIRVHY